MRAAAQSAIHVVVISLVVTAIMQMMITATMMGLQIMFV